MEPNWIPYSRIDLRIATEELLKLRKYNPFAKPVDPDVYPEYEQIVKNPIDLSTILEKINENKYLCKEYASPLFLRSHSCSAAPFS